MPFKIPLDTYNSEFEIKKSRFISCLIPLKKNSEIKKIIRKLKEENPQARHVVYAYIYGESGEQMGMSDDGEPHGTAGKPMLEVLKNSGFTMILVAVIRYFGGIKLGTGGLVQAYTKSVQDVLALSGSRELIPRSSVRLEMDYSLWNSLEGRISDFQGEYSNPEFTEKVTLTLYLPDEKIDHFTRFWTDITRGETLKFTPVDIFD